jgi:hypothetical protein
MTCRHHHRHDKPHENSDALRKQKARDYRIKCANHQYATALKLPNPQNNGDEERYAAKNYFSQYTKGLPHHSSTGLVRTKAYHSLLKAAKSGNPKDYEAIITEGAPVKLVNPQAVASLDLQGCDAQANTLKPAPTFTSDEQGCEMIELYWMSLLRDAPFFDFTTEKPSNYDDPYHCHEHIVRASEEMTSLCGVTTTPETLFRNVDIPGVKYGPFISQFLYKEAKMGAVVIDSKMEMPFSKNYLTAWSDFLENQNGQLPTLHKVLQGYKRYITTPRDLTHYVEKDVPYQGALQAALILFDMGVPVKKSNPYAAGNAWMKNQAAFVTLGKTDLFSMLAAVTNLALKGAWFQKWNVHRRLRPEAYAGCVDRKLLGYYDFPVNEKVLQSEVLTDIFEKYASYLLPQAYPEGAPLHPSYVSGHSVFAGASITILKAWFDEKFIIPNPVQATGSGNGLIDYEGKELTVGGELNKLAFNIGVGREMAGIHYRSDNIEGLKLGEQIATAVLKDRKGIYNEPFSGWSFTSFDGTKVVV